MLSLSFCTSVVCALVSVLLCRITGDLANTPTYNSIDESQTIIDLHGFFYANKSSSLYIASYLAPGHLYNIPIPPSCNTATLTAQQLTGTTPNGSTCITTSSLSDGNRWIGDGNRCSMVCAGTYQANGAAAAIFNCNAGVWSTAGLCTLAAQPNVTQVDTDGVLQIVRPVSSMYNKMPSCDLIERRNTGVLIHDMCLLSLYAVCMAQCVGIMSILIYYMF